MNTDDAYSGLVRALTQASLRKPPPQPGVATAHDEEVMLFLLQVSDIKETTQILMDVISMSEFGSILKTFESTHGLIRKTFHIDDAYRLKDRLLSVGTVVEFRRPMPIDTPG